MIQQNNASWYDQEWRKVSEENSGWTDQQVTDEMSRRIWNANYDILINDIAHSRSPEEREQKIREHQSELDNYKASGINVDNHLKYLRDKQGMGAGSDVVNMQKDNNDAALNEKIAQQNNAAWNDQEWREVAEAHPDWTEQQVTDEMSGRIWKAKYERLINDIANSSSPEEREQKIQEHRSELMAYQKSGINVGNDVKYLRNTQGETGTPIGMLLPPDSTAVIDSELTEQDKVDGYHLELDEYGIIRRYDALGIMHPDDVPKWLDLHNAINSGFLTRDDSYRLLEFMDVVSTVMLMTPVGAPVKFGANVGKKAINKVRLIPGKEGIVTGGNSTQLGKNMLESMGVSHSSKWSGYQAQHVIPAEMANNAVVKKIGMNLDDASNGIFLRIPGENISTMSRHQGYHSVYNEVVERQLNKMDVNQSVDVLQKQVYDLQQNLKYLQEKGVPLYPSQGATVELWERQLSKLKYLE
jgi:hypothetical protein